MILTANSTEFVIDSQVIFTADMSFVGWSLFRIVIIYPKTGTQNTLYIPYNKITSYNGSAVIPTFTDLMTELISFWKNPDIETVNPKITVGKIAPVSPAVNDIWINTT